MNIKISSTGGLLLGDATNGYKEIASKEYVDTKTFSIAWGDITGKPSTFAPAEHTHSSLKNGNYTASLPTLTANGTIALASQIPAAQINANWTETSSSSKAYIQNKPTLGTAAAKDVPSSGNASTTQVVMGNDSRLTDARTPTSHTHAAGDIGSGTLDIGRIPTGTSSSTVALGNHTHSDYVSKSATAAQALHSSISTTLSSGEIKIKSSATSAGEAGLYVDSSDGYVWVGVGSSQSWLQKDRIGYTADGNSQTELMFPARTSSDEVKTIATTDQLLQIGTTATTAAAGNHTHSGYAASSHNHAAGNITSGTLAVARGGTGADGSSITKNYVLAAPSGSNGAVSFRALVAADLPSHTHSDYVSKSATGLQTLNSSLSFPYAKELILGEPGDGYGVNISAYTNTAMLLISKDFDEYSWLKPSELGYTTDGESTSTVLTFPVPAKSGVIATSVDLNSKAAADSLAPLFDTTSTYSVGDYVIYEGDLYRCTTEVSTAGSWTGSTNWTKKTILSDTHTMRALNIGSTSEPTSSFTVSEKYQIYHVYVGSDGVWPTIVNGFEMHDYGFYPFTLIVSIASGASTMTQPTLSGFGSITWTTGAGLPTSSFAGKTLFASCLVGKHVGSSAAIYMAVWRCQ